MKFDDFFQEYKGWLELKQPNDIFMTHTKLTEEVGEVAEGLFALNGSERKINKLAKKGQEPIDSLKEEIGDVIITALNLAVACGISHEDLFSQMQNKCKKRISDIIRTIYG